MLHRQDIYKILPNLEKKGLITKTIGKPFKIQAIPIETALHQLVLKEKEKSNRKIGALECDFKHLIAAIKEPQKIEEDIRFTLLKTDESILNTATQTIRQLKKEIKVALNAEILLSPLARMIQENLGSSPAKIKLFVLIQNPEDIEKTLQAFEKLNLNQNPVVTKSIRMNTFKHHLILDQKEVWIATEQKTESGFPCLLWTNDRNIVHVYEEYFEKGWNHSKTVTLYPKTKKGKNQKLVIA